MSRANDATIIVQPGAPSNEGRVDQVRNGNRWRVVAIDQSAKQIAAERLTDRGRAVFSDHYLNNHITLGYAATVHSAQGVTAHSSYALLGEGSSRAMLYVAMTRGRHTNEAFLYQRFSREADHDHTQPVAGDGVHIARRGNKYSAAHQLRTILANDDRPRTMHAEAERTERCFLPTTVANLLELQDQRRLCRRPAQAAAIETVQRWEASWERITAAGLSREAKTEKDGLGM